MYWNGAKADTLKLPPPSAPLGHSQPAATARDEPQRPQNTQVPVQIVAASAGPERKQTENAITLTKSHRNVGTNTQKRDKAKHIPPDKGGFRVRHSESTTSQSGKDKTKQLKSEESLRELNPPSHRAGRNVSVADLLG